jgi:hypothetical protein
MPHHDIVIQVLILHKIGDILITSKYAFGRFILKVECFVSVKTDIKLNFPDSFVLILIKTKLMVFKNDIARSFSDQLYYDLLDFSRSLILSKFLKNFPNIQGKYVQPQCAEQTLLLRSTKDNRRPLS